MTFSKRYLALILCILGLLIFFVVKKRSGTQEETFTVEKGTIIEAVYGIGTVTAKQSYQFKTAIALTLNKVFVKEGDVVKAGQPIAVLEYPVLAPFSGTITAFLYKENETITPQSIVFTLVDMKNRYIVVSLDQDAVLKVKPGQEVSINFESQRQKQFKGRVKSVFSHDNQFLVHILTPDLPEEFLPGMTSDVAIEISKKSNTLIVPIAAVKNNQVILKTNGKNKTVSVTLGLIDGEKAEIISGNIHAGDVILSH